MANRDDQPFRGLEPDHYRRSGLKDAVSHYLSPPNPLTSTEPQPFPNNLTMPYHARRIDIERRMRNHIAQLTALGYRVTVEPAA